MLNLRKVMGAKPKEHTEVQLSELFTPWGEQLDIQHVWEQHPTPQMQRTNYTVLNGLWQCAFVASGHNPEADLQAVCAAASAPQSGEWDTSIVVPFSPEAPLSGVRRQLQPSELLWYRRTFQAPELKASEQQRCLLHFQAVDFACACRVNGQLVGTHEGGYLPFTFDITEFLQLGENELTLCVADPSEFAAHVRGKQRFDRGDIWYTAQSGIWQTVWLEVVPAAYVQRLQIEANPQTGILVVAACACVPAADASAAQQLRAAPLRVQVFDTDGTLVASGSAPMEHGEPGQMSGAVAVQIEGVRAWQPSDPYLYNLTVSFGNDEVNSYCAFRSVQMKRDAKGHKRVFLNDKPVFLRGVLDQAYWPDGLMTAPCDEALVYDITAMRDAGFNLMRKHIKVENARWYYHCDRLGMLVLQDMVQGGDGEIRTWDWSYKPTLFKFSWRHFRDDVASHQERLGAGSAAFQQEWTRTCHGTVQALYNHPCIIGWSLFNEGWGQFDARKACRAVRVLDPTRVIDAVSGWYDQQCGDFRSVHNYFRSLSVWRDRKGRAFFVSEFGGFSHRVEGHSSLDECYGYEVYQDIQDWRRAVKALLQHMNSLQDKGLAGYVYTQVSDIEEETNGLLTYDRRMNKLA